MQRMFVASVILLTKLLIKLWQLKKKHRLWKSFFPFSNVEHLANTLCAPFSVCEICDSFDTIQNIEDTIQFRVRYGRKVAVHSLKNNGQIAQKVERFYLHEEIKAKLHHVIWKNQFSLHSQGIRRAR